jgi:hypothetical protein
MKVTVNNYLNARSGAASVNAPCFSYKNPGEFIDADQALIGTSIDGISVWYHSKKDGCYYWSGGIDEIEFKIDGLALDQLGENVMLFLAEAKSYYWQKFNTIIDGITGLYISHANNTHSLCFQVIQITQDVITSLPAVLFYKGFPINREIIEANFAELNWPYPGIDTPRKVSGSLSRMNYPDWGTCGIKVEGTAEANTGTFILTNFHVAAADLLKAGVLSYLKGDDSVKSVVMPSWNYAKNENNIIGCLYQGLFNEWHDLAIILLYDSSMVTNKTSDGTPILDTLDVFNMKAYQGRAILLYGSYSGKQSGIIISVNSSQIFRLNGKNYFKENLIQLGKISNAGDSGCPVLLDNSLIGILIGADNKYSYVLPIQRIFNYFNLKLSDI